MGHTYIKATFYNPLEYSEYVEGKRKLEEVEKVDVEALVDTGATFPAIPEDLVRNLKLFPLDEVDGKTANGRKKLKLTITLVEIEGKRAASYTIIRPSNTTPLIGVVTLEQISYRVDPTTGKLIKGLPLML